MKRAKTFIENMILMYAVCGKILEEDRRTIASLIAPGEQDLLTELLEEQHIEVLHGDKTDVRKTMSSPDGGQALETDDLDALTNEELAAAYQKDREGALEMLLEKNANFARMNAWKMRGYFGNRAEFDDLVSAAKLGMIEAAKHFDPHSGTKFITYATYWIRYEIRKEIERSGFAVCIPCTALQDVAQISRMESDVPQGGDVYIADADAMKGTKRTMTRRQVMKALRLRNEMLNCKSLDQPVGENGEETLADIIPGFEENGTKLIEIDAMKTDVTALLEHLDAHEKKIICARFGLNGRTKQTYREISEKTGLKKSLIEYYEKSALEKLKIPARVNEMKIYLQAQ